MAAFGTPNVLISLAGRPTRVSSADGYTVGNGDENIAALGQARVTEFHVGTSDTSTFFGADGTTAMVTLNGTDGSEAVTINVGATAASTLDVTGALEADSTLGADGDFRVGAAGANNFTVAAATGNTAVAGTLGVTGESTLASAIISDLTDNRILIAGTAGAVEDDANLTFDGTTFAVGTGFDVDRSTGNVTVGGTIGVTGEATLASAIVSDLTDNRIVIAGASGALEDDANFTFDGATFAVGSNFSVAQSSGNVTMASGTVTGNFNVGGNLVVTGDLVYSDVSRLAVSDDYIELNVGASAADAPGGFVTVNGVGDGTTTISAAIQSTTAGVASTSDAQVAVDDETGFSVNDVVQISGAADANNNGIFIVSATGTGTLDLAGMDTARPSGAEWAHTQLVTDATTQGTIQVVQVSAIRANNENGTVAASGGFETWGGHNAAAISYSTLATTTGSVSLQSAYDTGSTITTDSSGGDLTFDGTENFVVSTALVDINSPVDVDTTGAFAVDAAAASNFTVDSANLTLSTTTSGTLAVTSAGTLDLDGVAVNIDSSGALDITAADGQTLSVNHGGGSAFAIGATGAVSVTGESGSTVTVGSTAADVVISTTTSGAVDVNSAGAVTLDAAAASNFTVAAANLSLSTTTSGDVVVGAADGVDIDGATVDIDATGAFSIDGAGASNVTVDSANLTLSTTTSGNVVANAADNVDIDAGGTFDVLAAGAFSIDGTGASNVTATSGDLTLSTATSGDIALTSAGAINTTGNIVPAADSTDDLGSSSAAFANAYVDTVTSLVANDRVNIGTDAEVALHLPAFTDAERGSNLTPAAGDVIFNTTSAELQFYDGSQWTSGGGSSGSAVVGINVSAAGITVTDAASNDGAGVYMTTTADTVDDYKIASATNVGGSFMGVYEHSTGTIITAGPATVSTDLSGLTGSPTNGALLYAANNGAFDIYDNITFANGDWIQPVGWIQDVANDVVWIQPQLATLNVS